MRDGMIVQTGKYNDLLNSCMDFGDLVAAHQTSMKLVEQGKDIPGEISTRPANSPRTPKPASNFRETNGEGNSLDRPKVGNENSKLIKEEERETGKVSLHIYKLYFTEAYGLALVVRDPGYVG